MLYNAFLCLNNQVIYRGWSLFNGFTSFGEVVFNTGMTGYQEIMTDPSYAGQMLIFTYPEIGNTGFNSKDNESDTVYIQGIIAKNICFYPSNWRSKISIKDYIIYKRIPHIFGIDTRYLTKYITSAGVMTAYVTTDLNKMNSHFNKSIPYNLDFVQKVTVRNSYSLIGKDPSIKSSIYSYLDDRQLAMQKSVLKIVVVDFGVKLNILNRLTSYNCNIRVVPAYCSYKMVLLYQPDGILLSNGPGNPRLVQYGINLVKKLIKGTNIPIFGICMGHQILSLAMGAKTFKLKFGHRGLNHPIGIKQKSEITSQNHGFAVHYENLQNKQLNDIMTVSHLNFNDFTIAGIRFYEKPIFSVQYHPEASPGPHDSEYLFNIFIKLCNEIKKISCSVYPN